MLRYTRCQKLTIESLMQAQYRMSWAQKVLLNIPQHSGNNFSP